MPAALESPTDRKPTLKWVKAAAKLAVAAGLLAFLIQKVGGGKIAEALSRLDWRVFAAAVLGYAAMQAIKTVRLQILLRAIDVTLSYPRLLAIYFIGMFFNTVLPTIVGGDAVRVVYLTRLTGKLDRAAAAVLVERAVGVGVLIAIAAVTLVVSGLQTTPAIVYSVLTVTGGFLIGLVLLFSPWAYRAGTACMRAVGLGKLGKTIGQMQQAMATYRRQYGVLAVITLLSGLVEFIMIALYAVLAYGMGLRLPPAFFLMVVPVTVLVSMAPVTVSGLGVRELTWVFFLGQQGLPQADAVALSLAWFLLVTVSSMFGGPAFVLWSTPARPAAHPAPAWHDRDSQPRCT